MNGHLLTRRHSWHNGHGNGGDRPCIQLGRACRCEDSITRRQVLLKHISRKVRLAQLTRQARRRRCQDHGVMCRNVVVVGECTDVLDAQEKYGHE